MERIDEDPASPCRRLCQLSERRVCTGCGRTAGEISSWRTMTVQQKQDCIDNAAARMEPMADLMMD